jgi:hypothetical protein
MVSAGIGGATVPFPLILTGLSVSLPLAVMDTGRTKVISPCRSSLNTMPQTRAGAK